MKTDIIMISFQYHQGKDRHAPRGSGDGREGARSMEVPAGADAVYTGGLEERDRGESGKGGVGAMSPSGAKPDPWQDPKEGQEGDPLASGSDDPPPPASAAGRRAAIVVAFLFIIVIVGFLVWFISTNSERTEGGTFFGSGETRDRGASAKVARAR